VLRLHRAEAVCGIGGAAPQDGEQREKASETMRARKGVVKMLMASVTIYIVSYSPKQVLLFYNTFSRAPFHSTWVFLVFVTAMGYINSAANPILLCIFSLKYRSKFKASFRCQCSRQLVTANRNQPLLGTAPSQVGAKLCHELNALFVFFVYRQIPRHSIVALLTSIAISVATAVSA
jgi:hypothetical protein